MSKPKLVVDAIPEPTAEELRLAYTIGARSRSLEEHIEGEVVATVEFAPHGAQRT